MTGSTPFTKPAFTTGRNRGRATVTFSQGANVLTLTDDYDCLRDLLLDAADALDPGPGRAELLNRRIFDRCYRRLSERLRPGLLADHGWTKRDFLASVSAFTIGRTDEWENGWFPMGIDVDHALVTREQTVMTDSWPIDDLTEETAPGDDTGAALLRELNNDDLRELSGSPFDRWWSLTVTRPASRVPLRPIS